jgi:hypothetical protein
MSLLGKVVGKVLIEEVKALNLQARPSILLPVANRETIVEFAPKLGLYPLHLGTVAETAFHSDEAILQITTFDRQIVAA